MMKRFMLSSAKSISAVAILVAAMLSVITPADMRAETGEECLGQLELCSIEITKTCLFWIFFCSEEEEHLYYSRHTH